MILKESKKNRKMFIVADLVSLKTYRLMRWLGPDALAVVRPTQVQFLLLQYSLLCTVEYLSLPNLLLIS